MPITLNVGLSKKVGESNYGSRGASVNVEIELDGTLVTQPDRMRQHVRDLFGLARSAVEEELRCEPSTARDLAGAADTANGNGHHQNGHHQNGHYQNGHYQNGRNGGGNGNGNGNGRSATQSQARAIHAIARRQRIDLAALLQARHGVDRPEDLSLQEASSLIDELNGAASGNGGQR